MEKREEQILSEIRSMLSAFRLQLDRLDAKVAELQGLAEHETSYDVPIDLDIDEMEIPAEEPVLDDLPEEEPVLEDLPTEDPVQEELPDVHPEKRISDAVSVQEARPELRHDETSVFSGASPIYEAAQSSPKKRKAVIDVMAEKQSWRTDIPGTDVKDIRSAISLNDRIIFINLLFKTDPMAFQDALTRINAMESLDQVVDYIKEEHGDWDLDSELVYRFMMAVRRKVK